MPAALLVRPHDHRHRVPAKDALDAAFDITIAGIVGLLVDGDRVDIGRGGGAGIAHAAIEGPMLEPAQQVGRPLRSLPGDDAFQGVEPIGGLLRIVVGHQR